MLGRAEILQLFSPNSGIYLKNHRTITRLVCTHFNALIRAESKYGNKNCNCENFWKKLGNFGQLSALDISLERNNVNVGMLNDCKAAIANGTFLHYHTNSYLLCIALQFNNRADFLFCLIKYCELEWFQIYIKEEDTHLFAQSLFLVLVI